MAPLLFREMKGISNFSCASPASAMVCTSIDRRSMVRPTIVGRSIDHRRTPHLRDPKRAKALNTLLPKPPSKPKPYTRKPSTNDHLISPANSSRYLLNDAAFFEIFPELEPTVPSLALIKGDHEEPILRPSSSAKQYQDQVVVLRVSLHCKGCEGKVRKHISKMEGVTSFEIDFAAKKVTVMGNVTPLGVLNSVSKVKNAQFWPSAPRSSASF